MEWKIYGRCIPRFDIGFANLPMMSIGIGARVGLLEFVIFGNE
jgi:hypothetical protein